MSEEPRLVPVPDTRNAFEDATPEQAERMEDAAQACVLALHGMSYDEGFSAIAAAVACMDRQMGIPSNLVEAFAKGAFAETIMRHYELGAGEVTQ